MNLTDDLTIPEPMNSNYSCTLVIFLHSIVGIVRFDMKEAFDVEFPLESIRYIK